MKVRFEIEHDIAEADEPEDVKTCAALIKKLLPKGRTAHDVKYCTRLVQHGPTTFQNERVVVATMGLK